MPNQKNSSALEKTPTLRPFFEGRLQGVRVLEATVEQSGIAMVCRDKDDRRRRWRDDLRTELLHQSIEQLLGRVSVRARKTVLLDVSKDRISIFVRIGADTYDRDLRP